jgi:hypothetical protein
MVEIGEKRGKYKWHKRMLTLEVKGAEPKEVLVGRKRLRSLSVPDTGKRLVFQFKF